MSDLIRREDVISLVSERKCGYSLFDKTEAEIYHELAEVIQEVWKIPNAETTGALDDAIQEYIKDGYILAEPKVGKWFDHSDEGYVQCPFCGSLTTCEDNIDELHYCFNCGAKMEGSE